MKMKIENAASINVSISNNKLSCALAACAIFVIPPFGPSGAKAALVSPTSVTY
jgi:hypothetical protein